MDKIKKFSAKINLISLNAWQAILFLAFLSAVLMLFLLLLQPLPFSYVMSAAFESFGLSLFLNWLPLFLLMLFLYFAGLSAVASSTAAGALGILLGVANRFKILIRNDPLVPWDLLLGGELMAIAGSFGREPVIIGTALALLYIIAAVLAAMVIKSMRPAPKFRIAGVIGCILAAALINNPLYNNPSVNNRLHIHGNVFNQVNQFNSRGIVYSFIHAFNTNRIMRPYGYNPQAVKEFKLTFDTSGLERLAGASKPHIIMVMGEAFSEMGMHPGLDFTGFRDPHEHWRVIRERSIYGEIFVPNIGGGTADTEFDVLTGLNARHFRGTPFAFRMINSEFESMASILNSLGFRSEFMHPGFDWFYNRQNVYRYLGFERLVFIDEFEGVPTKGWYINERDTISRIISMFEDHLEERPGVPYFHFAITIQNHGPYPYKYAYDGVDFSVPNFASNLDLTDDDINALSNYFYGQADADVELARLVAHLENSDEPVVLVYFGDHLPGFNRRIYDIFFPDIHEHGSLEDLTRLFRLPFIIWLNDAAKELYEVAHPRDLTGSSGEGLLFSSSFLGAYVLEVLGITNISPFWDFVAELRHSFPIITETRAFDPNGRVSLYMEPHEIELLNLYRDWSYFRVFD